ncbi:MAG TPA: cytochrome C biogenesis protein [Rhodobacteraceae bacterium]|jgi:cytochrome c-type biogenesis protein|nr:cytochrome C biogenesis protein [Paracoccaceae bacterium]
MFGIEIFDASLLPAMLVALTAGLLSFLSPCVFPVVGPYLAYMGGITMNEMSGTEGTVRKRPLAAAAAFVLGLSMVFLLLGFTTSIFGQFFLQNQDWFIIGAGAVVMIFGVHFLGIYRIGFMDREARVEVGNKGGSAFGAYVLGLAFAFGWTPCLGPILGTILSMAALEGSALRGTVLLGVYAFGLGIPFLLVAAFFPSLSGLMNWMKRHTERVERVMGLLLWTIGLMMMTGQFSMMSNWLLNTFPVLQALG